MRFKSITKTLLSAIILLIVSLNAYSQNRTITGKVLDTANQGIIGAGVLAVGTTNGTITDVDGNFSLSVPKGTVLEISCIGFVSQEITIGDAANYTVILQEDSEMLEETVVIGYGVQRKSDLTGSIASVKSTDLDNRSVNDAISAIQGKAAGVQIVNASGAPGKSGSIQIRGYSSNTTNSPLMIVDGLKVATLDYLDPSNIESMEILKDAASAAIYGIEAGNGVILVTTKSGASQKNSGRITYSYQNTTESLANNHRMMNAQEYVDFISTSGINTVENLEWDGKTDTDWIRTMTEKGINQRHTIGFEGSNDKGSLYASLTSLNNNGIIAGDRDVYKRLTLQVNTQYKIKPWATIGLNASLESRDVKQVSEGSMSVLSNIIAYAPITPFTYTDENMPYRVKAFIADGKTLSRDENGNVYGMYKFGDGCHPATMINRSDNENNGFNVRGTAFLNLSPIKGFVFTSRLGFRAGYTNRHTYNYELFMSEQSQQEHTLTGTLSNNLYYQWENFANYNFKLNKHDFTVMAGMSFQHENRDTISGSANELTDYAPNFRYFDNAKNTAAMKITGAPSESANLSFFGRIGWNFENKYNLQASFRADAYDTSKLEKNHRWGYFPSVSGGWTISNEEFAKPLMSKLEINALKLRASWGINGNVNALSNYQYAAFLTTSLDGGYNFGSGPDGTGFIPGVSPVYFTKMGWWPVANVTLPNPEIKWETSHQIDIGLDLRMFSNRLTVGLDWYNKNTMDLLTSTTAPGTTGATRMYVNAGQVNNKGFEIELSWKDTINDFRYDISANAAFLKNKVVIGTDNQRVTGATNITGYPVTFFEEGYPLWYLGLYEMESIDQQTGAATYKDQDNNGTLDANDQVYAGKGIPDMTYGFTFNLGYKGFDLVVYAAGVAGVDKLFGVYNSNNLYLNRPLDFYKRSWSSPQSTGYTLPKPNSSDVKLPGSTGMMFDASFLKIKQIQLGYTLPKNIIKVVGLSNVRAYVSLDDWFTFTQYPGFDPETNGGGSSLAIDTAAYPISKKLVFGVNVAF